MMGSRRTLLILACSGAALATLPTHAAGLLDRVLEGAQRSGGSSSNGQLASGLKEALRVGTERTVTRLGARDGFNADPLVRILLPKKIEKARRLLSGLGLGGTLDQLTLEMNRAAEAAAPQAKTLFVDAITQMTFEDARQIFSGSEDAATQYLRGKMETPLAQSMRPVVDQSMAQVGAARTYENLRARVNAVPLAPQMETSLSDYVVKRAMDGLFLYIAREEAAIRKDPAKRTTELLRSVFGR